LEEIRKEYAKPSNINKYMKCSVRRKTNEELSENKGKLAVRNMCLSFKKGEIFGLLGRV
jgi:hypothetical protein